MTHDAKSERGDRRPLRVRDAQFWVPLARRLARQGVTPNGVSRLGLAAGLLSGLLLASTGCLEPGLLQRGIWVLAVLAVVARGFCNVLDGVVAVEAGRASPTGVLWNEVPDRISDVATLVGAGYAFGSEPLLGWAAALVAVLVAYARAQCRVAGAPMDFCGPMAKPMRMAVVSAAAIWSAVVPVSWSSGWGLRHERGVMAFALAIVIAGGLVTVLRRLHRAASALIKG